MLVGVDLVIVAERSEQEVCIGNGLIFRCICIAQAVGDLDRAIGKVERDSSALRLRRAGIHEAFLGSHAQIFHIVHGE